MILVNGKQVEVEYFPNKESKVKEFPVSVLPKNVVELFYEDDRDLIHLSFVTDYIDEHSYSTPRYLVIHYMPYSRMDRRIEGDMYTLKYISRFINNLRFTNVYVVDPHSMVTPCLLFVNPQSINWNTATGPIVIFPIIDWLKIIMEETPFYQPIDCVVLPDKGAYNKYYDTIKPFMFDDINVRTFHKERCPTTGKILDMKLIEPYPTLPAGCENVIIIDDLCSYGGTFLWAGDILREMGVKDITLVVTHLEESVFDGSLLNDDSPITRIYTSNSMIRTQTHPKINILPINIEKYIK